MRKLYRIRIVLMGDVIGTHECGKVTLQKANRIIKHEKEKERKRQGKNPPRFDFIATPSK